METGTNLVLSDLGGHVGTQLGASEWHAITQADVDSFAHVTRDAQWIHVDVERAAEGPFGATIAHGYFVLSLCTSFLDQALSVVDATTAINYGLNRVRFVAPVRVGSRIRGLVDLESAEGIDGGGVQAVLKVTVELEGAAKPACVADLVVRYLP